MTLMMMLMMMKVMFRTMVWMTLLRDANYIALHLTLRYITLMHYITLHCRADNHFTLMHCALSSPKKQASRSTCSTTENITRILSATIFLFLGHFCPNRNPPPLLFQTFCAGVAAIRVALPILVRSTNSKEWKYLCKTFLYMCKAFLYLCRFLLCKTFYTYARLFYTCARLFIPVQDCAR